MAPADEIDISRTNVGAYVDVETDINDALLIATALRFEDYSDFGSNLSGKLAARYKLFDAFALRADMNVENALQAFSEFTHVYQASSDQPLPLFRRRA